jgi:septal ring factor EnvC (AmiA/AmiB activator)
MIRSMADQPDLAQLRTRVAALEAENAELRRRTDETVARETRQARKLDELGVDLNEVMSKPGAEELRGLVRAVRAVYRQARFEIPKRIRLARAQARLNKH